MMKASVRNSPGRAVEYDCSADDTNDNCDTRAGIVDGLPQKIDQASADPEKRSNRIKDQRSRRGAQQGKRSQPEHRTQLKRAPALVFPAHSTQIVFGMRATTRAKLCGNSKERDSLKAESKVQSN